MSEAILSSPGYRPRGQHGGYPRVGSSSLYFTDGSKMPGARVSTAPRASRMMGGGDQGSLANRGRTMRGTTPLEQAAMRQQNIATARADGTFDAKRNAFNAANKGSYMDEAGQIGPKASPNSDANKDSKPTQFTSVPDGQGGNKMVKVPSSPATPASQPTAPTTPTSKPAASAPVGPPAPRPPATFEGKSRAEWFGDAAKRQGVNNAYSGDAVAEAQKASAKPAAPASPTVAAKPAQITPAVTTAKTATATPSLGHSPEAINKAISDAGKQAGVPPRTMAGPAAAPKAAMSVPQANEPDLPSRGKASFAEGSQRFTAEQRHINDLEQQAKPGMEKLTDAAKGAALGAGTAASLPHKTLATPVEASLAGAKEAGKMVGDAVTQVAQGVKNWIQGDQNAAAEAEKLKAGKPGSRLFSQNRTR